MSLLFHLSDLRIARNSITPGCSNAQSVEATLNPVSALMPVKTNWYFVLFVFVSVWPMLTEATLW